MTRVSQMIWPQFGHNLKCFVPCAKGVAPTAHMPMARAKIKKECSKHVMLSFVTLIFADLFSWVHRCACVAFFLIVVYLLAVRRSIARRVNVSGSVDLNTFNAAVV